MDSPRGTQDHLASVKMRQKLEHTRNMHDHLFSLRGLTKKLVKEGVALANMAKDFHLTAQSIFTTIAELPLYESEQEQKQTGVRNTFKKLSDILHKFETERYHVVQQIAYLFEPAINAYMNDDFVKVTLEKQKKLNLTINEYDQLHRKAHKIKTTDYSNELNLKSTQFHNQFNEYHDSLQKSLELGSSEIKEKFCSYFLVFKKFIHQSNENLQSLEPTILKTMNTNSLLSTNQDSSRRKKSTRLSMSIESAMSSGLEKEGYISIRFDDQFNNNNWKMYWVVVKNGYLILYKRWKSSIPKYKLDLRCVSIKSDFFNTSHLLIVVTPEITLYLKPSTFEDFLNWQSLLNNAFQHCYSATISKSNNTKETQHQIIDRLYAADANNKFCADCSAPNPDWASLNLGILICHECSGIHRSLGVQVSKIRSFFLDRWSSIQTQLIHDLGNTRVNAVFEAEVKNEKPEPNSPRLDKQKFIVNKYVDRRFVHDTSYSQSELDLILYTSIKKHDLNELAKAIFLGGNVNATFLGNSLIHYSVINDSTTCTEFLIHSDCQINVLNHNGYTPLDIAILFNRNHCVQLLQSIGATHNSIDPTLIKKSTSNVMLGDRAESVPTITRIKPSSLTVDKKHISIHRVKSPPLSPTSDTHVIRTFTMELLPPVPPQISDVAESPPPGTENTESDCNKDNVE